MRHSRNGWEHKTPAPNPIGKTTTDIARFLVPARQMSQISHIPKTKNNPANASHSATST